jgi:hypothetical protein
MCMRRVGLGIEAARRRALTDGYRPERVLLESVTAWRDRPASREIEAKAWPVRGLRRGGAS